MYLQTKTYVWCGVYTPVRVHDVCVPTFAECDPVPGVLSVGS